MTVLGDGTRVCLSVCAWGCPVMRTLHDYFSRANTEQQPCQTETFAMPPESEENADLAEALRMLSRSLGRVESRLRQLSNESRELRAAVERMAVVLKD